MKKILLYCLLFLLHSGVYAINISLNVEIQADGAVISSENALSKSDVVIYVRNLTAGDCELKLLPSGSVIYNFAYAGIRQAFSIGLTTFDKTCPVNKGDQIEVELQVTNSLHKYAGYSGVKTFTVGSTTANTSFYGAAGLNLIGAPAVEISFDKTSLTLCQGVTSGNTVKATPTDGSSVTWALQGGGALPAGITASGNTLTVGAATAPGAYDVVAKTGAVTSAPVAIKVNPAPQKTPVIELPINAICLNEEVILSISAATQESGVMYNWSTGDMSTDTYITCTPASKTTKYSVTPVVGTCTGKKSAEVTLVFKPDLSAAAPNYVCNITTYTASVVMTGGKGKADDFKIWADNTATTPYTGDVQQEGVSLNKLTFAGLKSGVETKVYVTSPYACGIVELKFNKTCSCAPVLTLSGGGTYCADQTPKTVGVAIDVKEPDRFKVWEFKLKGPEGNYIYDIANEKNQTSWTHTPTLTGSGQYVIESFTVYNADKSESCNATVNGSPVTVKINPKPTVALTVTPTGKCVGNALKLEATAMNGAGGYTYIWTGAGAAGKNTGLINTTIASGSNDYTVKVTDGNSCSSTVTPKETVVGYEVKVSNVVAAVNPVNYNSSTTLGCDVTLLPNEAGHIIPNGGYVWTNAADINGNNQIDKPATVNLISPTTYTVTVTDNYNCSASGTVLVNVKGGPLSVVATGAQGCEGTDIFAKCTATGGATTSYSYVWESEDNKLSFVDNTLQNPQIKKNTLAGIYKVRVTAKEGNNTAVSGWVTIQVDQVPEISGLTSDAPGNSCIPGTEVHINLGYASGGAQLTWSSDLDMIASESPDKMQVTTQKFPATNRKYKFTVRATNAIGSCPVDSSIYIDVKGSSLDITFKNNVDICQGVEQDLFPLVQVSGGVGSLANYKYTWVVSDPKLKLSATTGTNVKLLGTSAPGSYTIAVTVEDEKGNQATRDLTVKITEKPVLSRIRASKTLAYIGDDVTLYVDIQPTTGVTPEWTGVPLTTNLGTTVTTGPFTTDGTFTYTVNAKNGNCLADPLSIDIKVNTKDAPIDITMNDVEGCFGSVINLVGSAMGGSSNNYTFMWESLDPGLVLPTQFGGTNSVPANTAPGVYRIKVTASDGKNSNSKVINVTVKETPTITDAYATLQGGTDHITTAEMGDVVALTATARPVDVTYKWSSENGPLLGNNTSTVLTGAITVSGLLVYTVEASKNGCSVEESVVLNVSRPSVGALLTMEVDKKCANTGEQLTITIKATGGDTYSFILRNKYGDPVRTINGEGGPVWYEKVSSNQEGVYRLTDFKATKNGVDLSTSVAPTDLTASFFPTPTVYAYKEAVMTHCNGDELILKATGDAGLKYEWDKNVKDGVGFIPATSETYTVTATDANNCQNTSSVAVTLAAKPNVVVPEDVEICAGKEVVLKATGNADTYNWNNGVTNDVPFKPSKTANYVVEGKFLSTGCITRDTVQVVVNQPPYIVAASKHERNIAIGKNVSMGVKAVGKVNRYQWQWKENGSWGDLSDSNGVPVISGTQTDSLHLVNVPREWNGTELRCQVFGDCGNADTTFILYVKECFDLVAELYMGTGIRPDNDPTNQVDGWYCIGTPITLNAKLLGLEEDVEIENPVFSWKTDGRNFHDEHDKNINTNTANLTWIPQRWEDDVNVQVCVYSDGACDTVCSRILRLKARQPDVVDMRIVTSIDPARMFCPGDTVRLTVALKNEGRNADVHWYRDIFDKGTGLQKQFVMDQKDTWVRAVLIPSEELCVDKAVMDSVFLRVKDFVAPKLEIDNNTHEDVACVGDTLLFSAIWSDAGTQPHFFWQQDLWSRGYQSTAIIGVNDKDTWIKCTLVPGEDVCYNGPVIADSMMVRVREAGQLTIAVDMTDKRPGDELTFVSKVEDMIGTWKYSWYVNGNLSPCEEKDFITDMLKQNDVVYCAIGGNEVCLNKIFSNKLVVDYAGAVNRDTMITIYQDEKIKNLDMLKACDEESRVIFRIEIPGLYGIATITPNGKFSYTPNPGFVGTDYVKYVILDKSGKTQVAEGYIYVTVKNNSRFLVPNLITPNDDGLNDTWKLDFLADYPDHRILVYDRNGQLVFEAKNYQNDWDGTGQTKGGYVAHINLMNGVYTYVIDLGDKDKTILKSWIEIRADMNRRDYR